MNQRILTYDGRFENGVFPPVFVVLGCVLVPVNPAVEGSTVPERFNKYVWLCLPAVLVLPELAATFTMSPGFVVVVPE